MHVVIEGIIVVIGEIPADQIILVAIAILVIAIGPAGILQQVAGIDAAIAVLISDKGAIGGVVQITEGDQPIGIDILQLRLEADRYLALVQPDVQIQIRMGVIDAGINDADHRLHVAGIARRPGFARLAAILVLDRRLVAFHAPQAAIEVASVIADGLDLDVVGFRHARDIRRIA